MERINTHMNKFTSFIHTKFLTEGTINSTQFEIDLVKAFNEVSTEGKARGESLKYQNKYAQETAKSCIKALLPKLGGKPRLAYRMAGKAPPSVIAPAYTEGGEGRSIKSGEPKTDAVFMVGGKKFRCSIKNGTAFQVASAQTNEIYAVLNATFKNSSEGSKLTQTIARIITESGNETVYKATRKKFENEYGVDGFDQLLSRVTGFKSGAGVPTKEEIKQMNEFLGILGIREKLTIEMSRFMIDTNNRKKLLREFATGEKRFLNEDFIATHFLEWFDNGTIKFMDANEFITKTLPNFKFSLRDRGRKSSKSGGGSRGIAARIDYAQKAGDSKLEDEDLDETVFSEKELTERYNYYYNELNEGLGDWLTTAGKSMTKAGMKGYQYIKDGFKKLLEAIKKVISFIANLLSRGVGSFFRYLNLEPAELTYRW